MDWKHGLGNADKQNDSDAYDYGNVWRFWQVLHTTTYDQYVTKNYKHQWNTL